MDKTMQGHHNAISGNTHSNSTDPIKSTSLNKTPSCGQPINPFWVVLITLVAGLVASGPIAGANLFRCGYRKLGWLLGTVLSIFGIVTMLLAISWRVEWYWVTLSLSVIHILCGAGLFLSLRLPYRKFKASCPSQPKKRGSYREIITGIVGGAFISTLLGTVCVILYVLLMDRLFSTLMPVTFVDDFAKFKVFTGLLFLILSGAIAGGIIARSNPRIHPSQMILYGFALVWAYLTWLLALEVLIIIPGFQAGAATGLGWHASISPTLILNLIVGFWWSAFLLFFIVLTPGKFGKLNRAAQVSLINLAAGITLSIYFGYTADQLLAMGRYFERTASTEKAMKFYELGLRKEPKPWIASYLQYRVALSNHRLGNRTKAKEGFRRVVAKYTGNMKLVARANRFLDNLERSAKNKRVVLPGVETRTEYKGGYCVPNSLALAMRYWGANVTARGIGRQITGLGSGTFIVNQSWYAEQAGFRHDFLPMASIDDIKQCIDAGLPVLVYVPAHVFAIVGYDEALETFVTYDVATNDVWVEYIQKDFIKAWKRQNTTLVLAYPPEKESLIPAHIYHRLKKLSNNYLHYQLHYFNTQVGLKSVPHLLKAADNTGEFFFPLTVLYSDFPGLRDEISKKYESEDMLHAIKSYFTNDFDEGIHSAGQYHDEQQTETDLAFKMSIDYLIGQQHYDMVEDVLMRIDEEGQISKEMQKNMGMIHLARGEFEHGIDRLLAHDGTSNAFYAGLANLRIGNERAAIRQLVKTVSGCT